jgi:hypothetical protein
MRLRKSRLETIKGFVRTATCARNNYIEPPGFDGRKADKMPLHFKKSAIANSLICLIASLAIAQSRPPDQSLSANDLVRAVVANELKPKQVTQKRWMYRLEREEQGKKITKEVVQSSEGTLDRTVATDGHALNVNAQREELKRIEDLVRNRAEQQKLEQTRRKDAEQCRAFFTMIPDALTFSYAGQDGDLVRLSYRPNPAFQPPTREARVFHEMEGEMWVHATQRRLVRISGRLTADVKFAGGLLGHLEKGGHFAVEQRELFPGEWDVSSMEVEMKGKALLFKTIAIEQKEYRSDFHAVPESLTLAEAANMLTHQVLVAANR